jgi:hypothetical protein
MEKRDKEKCHTGRKTRKETEDEEGNGNEKRRSKRTRTRTRRNLYVNTKKQQVLYAMDNNQAGIHYPNTQRDSTRYTQT